MSVRTRLAVGLTLSTLAVVALVAIAAVGLSLWRADDPDAEAQAGAVRLADGVAVVVIADDAEDAAAAARRDALQWVLVALAASVIPATAVSWVVSARVLGRVDDAAAEVELREQERRRRLDEVIHELRTPLAVAGTNLELAASDPAIDPDTGRLIDAARRATERMSRTVDDLAEHGRLAVDASDSIDLAAVARAVVTEHAGPARARSLQLGVAGSAKLPVPAGDRAAVQTALGNLVNNAVRLAPGGSTVTVTCGERAGWAWAAVTDEGPGIAAADHHRVFERGWRGRHDRHRDRGDDQRGLGLTIARQLTEANGGRLTLDSDEGVGSTFTVWLPMTSDAREADITATPVGSPASA